MSKRVNPEPAQRGLLIHSSVWPKKDSSIAVVAVGIRSAITRSRGLLVDRRCRHGLGPAV